MIEYLILAITGMVLDYLVSINWIQIQKKNSIMSGVTAAIALFATLIVWDYILSQPDNLGEKIAYSIGGGMGCFYAVYMDKRKKK